MQFLSLVNVDPENWSREQYGKSFSSLSCQPDPVPEVWTLDTMTEKSLGLDPEVAGVIAGHDLHISFVKLVKAASFLSRPEVVFLATNTDGQFPMKSSQVVVPGQRPASA